LRDSVDRVKAIERKGKYDFYSDRIRKNLLKKYEGNRSARVERANPNWPSKAAEKRKGQPE
jgi:hypothetical protein